MDGVEHFGRVDIADGASGGNVKLKALLIRTRDSFSPPCIDVVSEP
jgi:hypothetical protein